MIKYWLLATRPKTLTAALVPIITASALVVAMGYKFHWWISIFALLSSLFIQIGTNLINDASDFKNGADTVNRIGPMRVTQSGIFSYRRVIAVAVFCFVLAILLGLPLVYLGGWPIVLVGALSVLFGVAYTAGPYPLAYLGLGDLFVVLFFGLIAVLGLVFLQTGQWLSEGFVLGMQVGLHCAVLIAINNLRDIDGDRVAKKMTLPARFGKKFARWQIAIFCFSPFIFSLYWLHSKLYFALVLPLLSLPLAIRIVFLVFNTEPGSVYNKFLAKGAGLHLGFGILTAIGFLL